MLAAQATSGGRCARLDVHFINTLPVAAAPKWMAALLVLGLLHWHTISFCIAHCRIAG